MSTTNPFRPPRSTRQRPQQCPFGPLAIDIERVRTMQGSGVKGSACALRSLLSRYAHPI